MADLFAVEVYAGGHSDSVTFSTLANYQRNLVRINQAIGHIRLKDLTTFHIQAF